AGAKVCGKVQGGAAATLPGGWCVAAVVVGHDVGGDVVAGYRPSAERHSGGVVRVESVDAVNGPAARGGGEGDEVPAAGPQNEVVRFDPNRRDEVRVSGVGPAPVGPQNLQAQQVAVADGVADGVEDGGRDRGD